ncbi:MAG: hypothetical protein IKY09_02765 [Methanocorpusculum sp.]|nr:hypothetical protein [Methanocorpusculum sp.]MBR5450172.1 hypothetical protein [Methanocorpusculum sp.]
MKYIQSFYQYPVTFSSIGKTIPARSAQGEMKNIAEVSEKELDKLRNCEPFFRELENKKKIRVLNHIPDSYVPPAQQINAAHAETDKVKAENEALKARIAELEAKAGKDVDRPAEAGLTDSDREKQYEEMTYTELQDACKYAGIEYKNKKKAELIKELKAFVNQ